MMATMTTSTKMTTVTTTTTTTKMTNSDPCLAVNLPNARCTECDSWSSERCCEPDYFGMNKISADGCEEMYRERIRDLATFWTSLYLIFRKLSYSNTTTSNASETEFKTLLRQCLDKFHQVKILGEGVQDHWGRRGFRVAKMLLYNGRVIVDLRIPLLSELEALRSYLKEVQQRGDLDSMVWVWDVEGELYEPEREEANITQNITIVHF